MELNQNRPRHPGGLITITVQRDRRAALRPAVPCLEPVLTYAVRTFTAGGPTGCLPGTREYTLAHPQGGDTVAFPAGLVPRVVRTLRDDGYGVDVQDLRRAGPPLELDPQVMEYSPEHDRVLLGAVRANYQGQIAVPDDRERLRVCMLVAEACHAASVVMPVPTQRQAWRVWREVEGELREPCGLLTSRVHRRRGRLTVCTPTYLPGEESDVVLLPYGEQSTGDAARYLLGQARSRRVYAVVREPGKVDSLTRLRLEVMAGEVIVALRRPTATLRVLFLATPGRPMKKWKTDIDYKRGVYYHHDLRNKQIAAVAKAITGAGKKALSELGLPEHDVAWIRRCRPRVVVLVESPEHGRRLLPLLPGWPLRDATQLQHEPTAERQEFKHQIVTTVVAAERGVDADVVVCAAGTAWPPTIKNFPPAQQADGAKVMLIDFADEFDPRAANFARRRAREYRRRGHTVHGIESHQD